MRIGTPMAYNATKILLLGSGELGKEFAIEAMRIGIEVIAVDSYQYAPAQQVAHRYYVIDMKNADQIRNIVYREKPDFIVPEIEAINTDVLLELEREGFTVIPSAKAVKYTMDRVGIRKLAAEELGLKTSKYSFAEEFNRFREEVLKIGFPCVVKPVMSSSGKGQSVLNSEEDIEFAWKYAQENARGGAGQVIIEEFIDFDFEITLLTVRTKNQGTLYCEPIGHFQVEGDYWESWQPQPVSQEFNRFREEVLKIGFPCVVKPVMSSSGKGQSVLNSEEDIEFAWKYAQENARGGAGQVIIEEFIDFDFEITLLTVRTKNQGTLYCEPIGHFQVEGDYWESWQPQPVSPIAIEKAKYIAKTVTDALGGYGIFGCELFVKDDEVWFNEISPRPHDTGMVTMVTQNMSEFEIHLRAILGLPISIDLVSTGASYCFHAKDYGVAPSYEGIKQALSIPNTKIRIFGKPTTRPKRRMGVALATADSLMEARENARKAAELMKVYT